MFVKPKNTYNVLIVGKTYEVLKIDRSHYFVLNEHSEIFGYYKEKFRIICEIS